MKMEKTEAGFRLSGGGRTFDLDQESYEDLFYAIPVNTTAFYRLLTEQAARTEEERARVVSMLEAEPDLDTALNDLQQQIQNLPPDERAG